MLRVALDLPRERERHRSRRGGNVRHEDGVLRRPVGDGAAVVGGVVRRHEGAVGQTGGEFQIDRRIPAVAVELGDRHRAVGAVGVERRAAVHGRAARAVRHLRAARERPGDERLERPARPVVEADDAVLAARDEVGRQRRRLAVRVAPRLEGMDRGLGRTADRPRRAHPEERQHVAGGDGLLRSDRGILEQGSVDFQPAVVRLREIPFPGRRIDGAVLDLGAVVEAPAVARAAGRNDSQKAEGVLPRGRSDAEDRLVGERVEREVAADGGRRGRREARLHGLGAVGGRAFQFDDGIVGRDAEDANEGKARAQRRDRGVAGGGSRRDVGEPVEMRPVAHRRSAVVRAPGEEEPRRRGALRERKAQRGEKPVRLGASRHDDVVRGPHRGRREQGERERRAQRDRLEGPNGAA